MFDAIKNLFNSASAQTQPFAPDDHRVMAAALLVHVMAIDGVVTEKERQKLETLVKTGFGLNDAETAELIAEAERREREAIDLYGFTSLVKRALDEDGRLKLVEMLWDMAFADGHLDEFERNVIWRIAELIGVSARSRVLLQQKVRGQN